MKPYILSIQRITANDLPRVGGKGANLGEMTKAGFNVPPGFCVTTEAFDRFMAGANEELFTQLRCSLIEPFCTAFKTGLITVR